jgi:predicted DNA-binding helix-hairpin-helix protein
VTGTPFDNLAAVSPMREFRLYQASFLLRDYGWTVEDLPFSQDTNLPLNLDPKRAWADQHLRITPVEINTASRTELLRVPGIGPTSADAILLARRHGRLRELYHLHALGVRDVDKAAPYILLNGRSPWLQMSLL